MRMFSVCGLLTMAALDVVILSWLGFHGWLTRPALTAAGWVYTRQPFTATDFKITIVILLAHLVFGYLYFRSRSKASR